MDQDRQIRLLIPPFFLIGAMAFIAHTAGADLVAEAEGYSTEQLLAIGGVVGASALPGGYLLTSLTLLLLRGIASLFGWATYEAHISEAAYGSVWTHLGLPPPAKRDQELFAVATFDHELLSAGVHTWLMRRWNAFNIAVSSMAAIVLAAVLAAWMGIFPPLSGWLCLLGVCLILGATGLRAWRQTMQMIEFQAHLPANNSIQRAALRATADAERRPA